MMSNYQNPQKDYFNTGTIRLLKQFLRTSSPTHSLNICGLLKIYTLRPFAVCETGILRIAYLSVF